MGLYTKSGRPLQVVNDKVYSRSGIIVGRIKGEKVYGTDGRYVGTIVGDRLVYRSTQSATISSPFSAANRMVPLRQIELLQPSGVMNQIFLISRIAYLGVTLRR